MFLNHEEEKGLIVKDPSVKIYVSKRCKKHNLISIWMQVVNSKLIEKVCIYDNMKEEFTINENYILNRHTLPSTLYSC